MGQRHAPTAFYAGDENVPILQGAEWDPQPLWKGVEKLATPGFEIRTVHPAVSSYID
jgi:hypothetical protein